MLDPQMKRGLIENCVLALLSRGDSYGYQIIKDLSDCTEISESTLYPILRRQETAGYLRTYSIAHNGRLRKFYQLTDDGKKQLSEFADSFSEVLKMYRLILSAVYATPPQQETIENDQNKQDGRNLS